MKHLFLLLAALFGFLHLSAQNVVHYSYDSVGNRIQRDTTSTNVTMLTAAEDDAILAASVNRPASASLGEVVISGGGTSPETGSGCIPLEKFWPIKSQPLQARISRHSLGLRSMPGLKQRFIEFLL